MSKRPKQDFDYDHDEQATLIGVGSYSRTTTEREKRVKAIRITGFVRTRVKNVVKKTK